MKKLFKILKTLTPCLGRRRRNRRRVRRANPVKPDVEMATVDLDGKRVLSNLPEEPAESDERQPASASDARHVHFNGPP